MRSEVAVRRAVPDDAHPIAMVHVQAWREAYAHLLPSETLASLDVGRRASRWDQLIGAGAEVWVAEAGENMVGWASASAGRDDDAPRDLELEGIYILASAYGSGAGQALFDAAIGVRPAYLWMAAENPRARRFYERNGFAPDGGRKVHMLVDVPIDVVRLTR